MTLGVALVAVGTLMFAGEVLVSAARGRALHRWKDTLAGMGMQAATAFVSFWGKLFLLLLYVPLQEAFAVWTWSGAWWAWLGAFLLYDFTGYWFHRVSHRTNLGWAVHVVHHQSEELNLATAVRTAPLRSLLDWPTLLPLAVLGIPPHVLATLYILHAAGQYWLHVQWIGRLGPLEWVLNTPSAHRVHHGLQPGYQDCNYGAHLIVFDRLFGTFVPETEPAKYGVTHPAPGWNPVFAMTEPFAQVWRESRDWPAQHRVQVWLRPPGWRPDAPVPAPRTAPAPRVDFELTRLGPTLAHTVTMSLLLFSVHAPNINGAGPRVALGLLGAWTLLSVGQLLDDRQPGTASEGVRAALIAALALILPTPLAVLMLALATVTLAATLWPNRSGTTLVTAQPQ